MLPVANAEDGNKSMIELLIESRERDLGGFSVRRVLPHMRRRLIGPFIFIDQMGPATFSAGEGIDVRPHPHINLATVTFLYDGAIAHRDSLGSNQDIVPGDVNWMVAGSGIVHSERTPATLRASGHRLYGLQTWVALPSESEEVAPSFSHHPAQGLPQIESDGVRLTVVAGSYGDLRSPVAVYTPTLYLAGTIAAGAQWQLRADHAERAVYLLEGELLVAGQPLKAGQMAVLTEGVMVTIEAVTDCHLAVFGGAKLDGERHLWWNFVSSRAERLEQAKADWLHGRFDPVPGESEFIPLPSD